MRELQELGGGVMNMEVMLPSIETDFARKSQRREVATLHLAPAPYSK